MPNPTMPPVCMFDVWMNACFHFGIEVFPSIDCPFDVLLDEILLRGNQGGIFNAIPVL